MQFQKFMYSSRVKRYDYIHKSTVFVDAGFKPLLRVYLLLLNYTDQREGSRAWMKPPMLTTKRPKHLLDRQHVDMGEDARTNPIAHIDNDSGILPSLS